MPSPIANAEFSARLEEHKGILYKVAHAYCRNAEDRKDLIQEITVQLWESYDRYDSRFKFSTWMYRVALNTAISAYRREKRRPDLTEPLGDVLVEEPPDTTVEEQIAELYRIIGRFDELNRALMLLYLDDHSYREIAAILGITETNVATKINRLKQKIKGQFSPSTPA